MPRLRSAMMATLVMMASPALADAPAACPGGYAPAVRIGGTVAHPLKLTLADLQARPSTRLTVSYYSGKSGLVTETYTGVLVSDLLDEAEVKLSAGQKNDLLRRYLLVTATDCYQVVVAVPEVLSTFGGQAAILAYADGDGHPLDDSEGMARLIVPGDKSGGRSVSNVTHIIVRTPGPAPQTTAP
ncbi:MAG: molybdopterin-dependent oxidoreductase [Rhodospirillales bacterium]|nr:molybdopterin-dependent oxidoreductase [Rhodospirillales bacterium]